jgi:hypothetical protein
MLSSTTTRAFLLLCLLVAVTSATETRNLRGDNYKTEREYGSCCALGKTCDTDRNTEERVCSARCKDYLNGGGPQCHVVKSCGCIPDPEQKRRGGTWRDTTPVYITIEQFHVLGGECKIGDATPSTCEIPENLYPKLSPKTLPPETKPPRKPDVEPATRPPVMVEQEEAPVVVYHDEDAVAPLVVEEEAIKEPVEPKEEPVVVYHDQEDAVAQVSEKVDPPDTIKEATPVVEEEEALMVVYHDKDAVAPLVADEAIKEPVEPKEEPVVVYHDQEDAVAQVSEVDPPNTIKEATPVIEEEEALMVVYHDKDVVAPLVADEAIKGPVEPKEEPVVVYDYQDLFAPVSEADPPTDTTKEATPKIAQDGQDAVAPMSP